MKFKIIVGNLFYISNSSFLIFFEIINIASKKNESWARFSGNPLAACFVTGAAALIFAVNKKITPQQVKQILKETAKNIDYANKELIGNLGTGKLDILKFIVS